MSILKIKFDEHKDFFAGEHGKKLIEEIIKKGEYEEIKCLAEWEKCPSKYLGEIAVKHMVIDKNAKNNLKILEEIAENKKTSLNLLLLLFEFILNEIDNYKYDYGEEFTEVLEEIAENDKLTEDLAIKLYNLAREYSLHEVVEELAENEKTPDKVLYDILDDYHEDSKTYKKTLNQICKRYKMLKEELSKKEA